MRSIGQCALGRGQDLRESESRLPSGSRNHATPPPSGGCHTPSTAGAGGRRRFPSGPRNWTTR